MNPKLTNGLHLMALALFCSASAGLAAEKDWENVRVTDDDAKVAGCTFIGEVKGKSSYGGLFAQNIGEEKAYKHLKRNAWEMGANTVLMIAGRSGFGGSKYRGEAYRCESEGMRPDDAVVLGGVEICGPENPSLDYLDATRDLTRQSADAGVYYTFNLPISIEFGDLEPNSGYLVTKAGRVDQVVVEWSGLTEPQQKSVWSELLEAFVASKGNPKFEEADLRASWSEAGGRKETWISRNSNGSSVRIAVICREHLSTEQGKTAIDAAF